jgi:hypothetical protein
MKKLLPFLFAVAASPTYAEITTKYVTSAQISIDSPYVITNAAPSSYSISGNNITTSTGTGDSVVTNAIGGLNLGSFGSNGAPNAIHTNKTVTTAGSAFSLSETYQAGDGTQSAITPSSGIATLPVLGGQTTVISGGTAGSLGLTSVSSGIHTCSAGGSGTSCIGSTTVTITID